MPALVRWRVVGANGRVAVPWRDAADFRTTLPSRTFGSVYATWTRQNKPWRRGRYRVVLARGWNSAALRAGSYRLEVFVCDTRHNAARSSAAFTVATGR